MWNEVFVASKLEYPGSAHVAGPIGFPLLFKASAIFVSVWLGSPGLVLFQCPVHSYPGWFLMYSAAASSA